MSGANPIETFVRNTKQEPARLREAAYALERTSVQMEKRMEPATDRAARDAQDVLLHLKSRAGSVRAAAARHGHAALKGLESSFDEAITGMEAMSRFANPANFLTLEYAKAAPQVADMDTAIRFDGPAVTAQVTHDVAIPLASIVFSTAPSSHDVSVQLLTADSFVMTVRNTGVRAEDIHIHLGALNLFNGSVRRFKAFSADVNELASATWGAQRFLVNITWPPRLGLPTMPVVIDAYARGVHLLTHVAEFLSAYGARAALCTLPNVHAALDMACFAAAADVSWFAQCDKARAHIACALIDQSTGAVNELDQKTYDYFGYTCLYMQALTASDVRAANLEHHDDNYLLYVVKSHIQTGAPRVRTFVAHMLFPEVMPLDDVVYNVDRAALPMAFAYKDGVLVHITHANGNMYVRTRCVATAFEHEHAFVMDREPQALQLSICSARVVQVDETTDFNVLATLPFGHEIMTVRITADSFSMDTNEVYLPEYPRDAVRCAFQITPESTDMWVVGDFEQAVRGSIDGGPLDLLNVLAFEVRRYAGGTCVERYEVPCQSRYVPSIAFQNERVTLWQFDQTTAEWHLVRY